MELLKKLKGQDENITLEACIEMFSIAEKLYDIKEFVDLYKQDAIAAKSTEAEKIRDFDKFKDQLESGLQKSLDEAILKKVLSNPLLVGDTVSKYFEYLNVNLKKRKADEITATAEPATTAAVATTTPDETVMTVDSESTTTAATTTPIEPPPKKQKTDNEPATAESSSTMKPK